MKRKQFCRGQSADGDALHPGRKAWPLTTEVQSDAPHVFGPISDLTTVAFNLLILPVVWRFHRRLARTAGTRTLWWVLAAMSIAGAIGSTLLVLRVLDFAIATSLSIGAIVVQAVWYILANRLLLKLDGYSRGLGRYGIATGASLLVGMAIIAIGLLLPTAAQAPFWIIGVALGLFGWVSAPVWFFCAGLRLRRGVLRSAE